MVKKAIWSIIWSEFLILLYIIINKQYSLVKLDNKNNTVFSLAVN